MTTYDLIITGAGIVGMTSAIEAKKQGFDKVLLIERENKMGGSLSGAEYIVDEVNHYTGQRYIAIQAETLKKMDVEVRLATTVLKIEENNTVALMGGRKGIEKIRGKKVLMATGVREKGKNPLSMVGNSVTGIFTVGMARKLLKSPHHQLGRRVLIVGTTRLYRIIGLLRENACELIGIVGDEKEADGLIEGATWYEDYELSSVCGKERINQVTLTKGIEKMKIKCDTIILAAPMVCDGILAMKSGIKVNDLSGVIVNDKHETSMESVYACGGCVKPDFTISEAIKNAENAIISIKQSII